jgi:hypothetical protein
MAHNACLLMAADHSKNVCNTSIATFFICFARGRRCSTRLRGPRPRPSANAPRRCALPCSQPHRPRTAPQRPHRRPRHRLPHCSRRWPRAARRPLRPSRPETQIYPLYLSLKNEVGCLLCRRRQPGGLSLTSQALTVDMPANGYPPPPIQRPDPQSLAMLSRV